MDTLSRDEVLASLGDYDACLQAPECSVGEEISQSSREAAEALGDFDACLQAPECSVA